MDILAFHRAKKDPLWMKWFLSWARMPEWKPWAKEVTQMIRYLINKKKPGPLALEISSSRNKHLPRNNPQSTLSFENHNSLGWIEQTFKSWIHEIFNRITIDQVFVHLTSQNIQQEWGGFGEGFKNGFEKKPLKITKMLLEKLMIVLVIMMVTGWWY